MKVSHTSIRMLHREVRSRWRCGEESTVTDGGRLLALDVIKNLTSSLSRITSHRNASIGHVTK